MKAESGSASEKRKVSVKISLPAEIAEAYGFTENGQYDVREYSDGIFLRQSPDILKRIYVEVTNKCNLSCSTCVRNVWSESTGMMDRVLFEKILSDAGKAVGTQALTIFFGGWGEPLLHPDIVHMISLVKKYGWRAELITNGVMLTEAVTEKLVTAGLDFLWVSVDGATPESYSDVRLGDKLPVILENLWNIRKQKAFSLSHGPEIGIAFVAMRKNIGDLPEIIDICRKIEAKRLSVSNILPFTAELLDERLYRLSACSWGKGDLRIEYPRMDPSDEVAAVIRQVASAGGWHAVAGNEEDSRIGVCPFIRKASLSVRWDGKVSPCTPLFYDSQSYLDDTVRESRACHFGDVGESPLYGIWMNDEYRKLRRKLQVNDFSPCTVCNSCEMAESNEEDCFGDQHPACGGCLWQQGFVQCP